MQGHERIDKRIDFAAPDPVERGVYAFEYVTDKFAFGARLEIRVADNPVERVEKDGIVALDEAGLGDAELGRNVAVVHRERSLEELSCLGWESLLHAGVADHRQHVGIVEFGGIFFYQRFNIYHCVVIPSVQQQQSGEVGTVPHVGRVERCCLFKEGNGAASSLLFKFALCKIINDGGVCRVGGVKYIEFGNSLVYVSGRILHDRIDEAVVIGSVLCKQGKTTQQNGKYCCNFTHTDTKLSYFGYFRIIYKVAMQLFGKKLHLVTKDELGDNSVALDVARSAISGDRRAQKSIYDYLSGKMYAVCLRYMGDRDVAEDVLQDGFVNLFTKLDSYSGDGSFEGWARKIFVNTALMSLRKKDVLKESQDVEEARGLAGGDASAIQQLGYKEILDMIGTLPAGFRTVFNLYVMEGHSHKEIAQMLDISEVTSRSQLQRARTMLQAKIKSNTDAGRKK